MNLVFAKHKICGSGQSAAPASHPGLKTGAGVAMPFHFWFQAVSIADRIYLDCAVGK